MNHHATYDPADDKIRIYPAYRLPVDEYQALKAAGYGWAPKQECFYAVWSPSREDAALQLADEIGDEDTSLMDRAEQRAERFEDYSDKRAHDAERAHAAVQSIADNIPFGQPILVGHHSERRARRDAEKIENGMRKAVKMWETSEYWTSRAAGAIAHAKYKELPAVRARRIKGLEADKRKREKNQKETEKYIRLWSAPDLTKDHALAIAAYDHISKCFTLAEYPRDFATYEGQISLYSALKDGIIDASEASRIALRVHGRYLPHCNRWLDHINNRLAYERAMLGESGGLAADRYDFQVGGKVRHKWGWNIIKKLNKKDGVLLSLSLVATSYPSKINLEDVKEYIPPTEEETEKVKTATKLPPMCNYITPECATMTQAEYTKQYKEHKGSRVVPATDEHGAHRIRTIQSFLGRRFGSTSQNQWGSVDVFISDAKVTPPPKPTTAGKPVLPTVPPPTQRQAPAPYTDPTPGHIKEMKASLKAGVQAVSAPQLFPTPPEVARRMVSLAGIMAGYRILEPSAGTGNLIEAVVSNATGFDCCRVVAVEINSQLARALEDRKSEWLYANDDNFKVINKNFLECTAEELGQFPRIIMNPPFENGSDIKHILHARDMLKPGGKLVAICAAGPRQIEKLQPLADTWEELPEGTFAGTGVRTVMLSMSK